MVVVALCIRNLTQNTDVINGDFSSEFWAQMKENASFPFFYILTFPLNSLYLFSFWGLFYSGWKRNSFVSPLPPSWLSLPSSNPMHRLFSLNFLFFPFFSSPLLSHLVLYFLQSSPPFLLSPFLLDFPPLPMSFSHLCFFPSLVFIISSFLSKMHSPYTVNLPSCPLHTLACPCGLTQLFDLFFSPVLRFLATLLTCFFSTSLILLSCLSQSACKQRCG